MHILFIASVVAFGLALLIALLLVSITFTGYVISTLWGWFVVPFFGAPVLPVAMAAGLYVLSRLVFTRRTQSRDDDEDEADTPMERLQKSARKLGSLIASAFAWQALCLFFGWFAKVYL